MPISSTSGLSGAMQTSVDAINQLTRSVDEIAQQVASGISTDAENSSTELTASLSQLSGIKEQATANARVVEMADELLRKVRQ